MFDLIWKYLCLVLLCFSHGFVVIKTIIDLKSVLQNGEDDFAENNFKILRHLRIV